MHQGQLDGSTPSLDQLSSVTLCVRHIDGSLTCSCRVQQASPSRAPSSPFCTCGLQSIPVPARPFRPILSVVYAMIDLRACARVRVRCSSVALSSSLSKSENPLLSSDRASQEKRALLYDSSRVVSFPFLKTETKDEAR